MRAGTASGQPQPAASRRAAVAGVLAGLFVLAAALSTPALAGDRQVRAASPLPGRLEHSTIQTLHVASHDADRTSRTVLVYRPGVVDSPFLPVLYLLHGQYGTPNDPFDAGMQAALDRLFASGVRPFVVAVPEGISKVRYDDEWGDAVDGADELETFVGRDTVAAVEGNLRRDRNHRAIAGFSMGGYGAAVDAARQSSLFGQFVSLAGYFHLDDPQHVFGTDPTVRLVHTPLRRTALYDHTRVLLMDCSQEAEPVIVGELGRMRAALTARHHPPTAYVTAGRHDWQWVNAQWPLVARFLGQGWAQPV